MCKTFPPLIPSSWKSQILSNFFLALPLFQDWHHECWTHSQESSYMEYWPFALTTTSSVVVLES